MTAISDCKALIPYVQNPLQSLIKKILEKELVNMIYTNPNCKIGFVDKSRITIWQKEDWVIEKIRACNYLTLYQSGLDKIPESIRLLCLLHTIDLNGNRLTTLPKWIEELSLLEDLHLGRNAIQDLPLGMTLLDNLNTLNLEENQIIIIPSIIFDIVSLRRLSLDGNDIIRIPSEIKQLSKLEHFSIVQNGLMTIPEEIKDLKALATFCCLFENSLDEASIDICIELGNIVQG